MDEVDDEESNHLNSDRINRKEEGSYGAAVNQLYPDVSNQDFLSRKISDPIDDDFLTRKVTQKNGISKMSINLCIFGTIAFLIFITIMMIQKKEVNQKKDVIQKKEVKIKQTFRKELEECPEQQQFSPVSLNCVRCPSSCMNCLPGIGGSNPCVQCLVSFSLFGEDCVKTCPEGYKSLEGICLQDKKKRFSTGRLKINNSDHSVIDYMIYLPDNLVEKVVFLIPPVGSNQLYYSSQIDLSDFADSTDAAIITFSTPVHLVAKMVPHDSLKGDVANYAFVKILAEQLLSLVDMSDVEQYFYVVISDSLIIGLQLNNYIVQYKLATCEYCYQNIVFLQTQETNLSLSLKIDHKELVIVLDYINGQYSSKNSIQIQEYQDLKANQTVDLARKFNIQFSMEVLKKSSEQSNIELIFLNELRSYPDYMLSELQYNREIPIIVLNSTMSDLSHEQQKIKYLISNQLYDLISQHGSWLERQDFYDEL